MNATQNRLIKILAGSAAASLTLAASANTPVIPNLSFTMGSGTGSLTYQADQFGGAWMNANRSFGFAGSTGSMLDAPGGMSVAWNLLVNADPFIVGNIIVNNTSAVTQEYFLDIVLPIGMTTSHSYVGGSVTGTVTDLNGNGASLSSVGGAGLFTAVTDHGTANRAVAGSLLSATTITAAAFQSSSLGPASFGDPIPSLLHRAAAENITVQFRFTLTAGDSASFTSIFVAEAIPAPGALALLGIAGLSGRRSRRR